MFSLMGQYTNYTTIFLFDHLPPSPSVTSSLAIIPSFTYVIAYNGIDFFNYNDLLHNFNEPSRSPNP